MQYKVSEVYTPDDVGSDRRRFEHTFQSDSKDVNELAYLAWLSCHEDQSEATKERCKARLQEVIDDDQLIDFDETYLEFTIFGNNGEWNLTVTQAPGLISTPK